MTTGSYTLLTIDLCTVLQQTITFYILIFEILQAKEAWLLQ